jgi:hypothetical protein
MASAKVVLERYDRTLANVLITEAFIAMGSLGFPGKRWMIFPTAALIVSVRSESSNASNVRHPGSTFRKMTPAFWAAI